MEDVSIISKGKGKQQLSVLTIKNECTIFNIETIYKYILEKKGNINITKVKVSNISNLDLSGIQLLISLKKNLLINNPDVIFEYDISDDLKSILTHCGLNEIIHN